MLYEISGKEVREVNKTRFREIKKFEKDLEDWIENNPSILGEKLLIIGRQVQIPEVNDRIDLLALDTNGNVVIIEIKTGKLKDPVDIQALRYASYVSRWDYNDLERQANSYFSEKGELDFNFNEKFEEFCSSVGIDEVPDLNQDQRIIIVGSKLEERLSSVALWLRDHNIDIKIIEVSLFKDGEKLYLLPQVIIPFPQPKIIGKPSGIGHRPWLADGEDWHLNKRCGKNMRQKLIQLNNLINENFEMVEGPIWNQKFYVSFKYENHIWMYITTHKTTLILNILIKKGDMEVESIAKNLEIEVYDRSSSLSEKLQLKSSVEIIDKGEYDVIRIRVKDEFDVLSHQFLKFLKDCYNSFRKL
ncbi:hypothetical protein DRO97_07210 [Archaeoglobales archaeon]|nr:MAG: hypothetical protein DRO97_07210 [Archaeoglobales archaeon]